MSKHVLVIKEKDKENSFLLSEKREEFFSIYNLERRKYQIEDRFATMTNPDRFVEFEIIKDGEKNEG